MRQDILSTVKSVLEESEIAAPKFCLKLNTVVRLIVNKIKGLLIN